MATFQQNLAKIRGEAVYAPEMRDAIAEALEQSIEIADDLIAASEGTINGRITELRTLLVTVKDLVDNRELYIDAPTISETDHELRIMNAAP